MKTSLVQIVGLMFCSAMCSMVLGEPFSPLISPSPSIQNKTSILPLSSTPHNISSTVHPANSSSTHHNHSATIHHNTSTIHHNTSTIHHNTSTIHHNTSTIHHNASSTIHHNMSSSIMPSPSINFSITINMTSMIHSASHLTYTVSPSHTIGPNATSTVIPSSSSVIPTTTPPTPKWPEGKFSVKKGNDSCLMMWLSMKFTVNYKNESSGKMLSVDVIMPNSSSATASGSCGDGTSSIHIEWGGFYYVEATFKTAKTVDLSSEPVHWTTSNLTLYVNLNNNSAFVDRNRNVTDIKESISDPTKLFWLSGITGNSLNCSQKETVKFGSSITASFENVRIQPFDVKGDKFSDKVDVCMNSPTSSTTTNKPTEHPTKKNSDNKVAIAVGCSLAGLVLIVLIGYLIGRRRKNSIRYRKL